MHPRANASSPSRPGLPGARFDAVVVGRGAIGLAAALSLTHCGLRTAIVGPAPVVAPPSHDDDWDARVYAMSPASRDLLRELRAWDAMPATRIAPVHDMQVEGGPEPLRFSAYDTGIEALAWILENRSLLLALEPALRYAGVNAFEATLEGMETGDDAVRLRLADGTTLEASLVVGADGANSRVRELAGLVMERRPYDQTAVVANFRCGRPHLDTAWQWFRPDGILAMLPLPADAGQRARASMVWSAPHALAEELAVLPPRELARRASEAAFDTLGALEPLGGAQRFPLALGRVRRPIAPRVALVGDAAHTMHPLAGQGMNVGFGDVAALHRIMAAREPQRDPGDGLLLRRYARARADDVRAMQLGTDGLHRLFYRTPADFGPLRDAGWTLVARSGRLRRALISQAIR